MRSKKKEKTKKKNKEKKGTTRKEPRGRLIVKKENYLTKRNRKKKIAEWEKLLLEKYYSKKKPFTFKPEETALVIIDLQKFFLEKKGHSYIPAVEGIIGPIRKIQKTFQEKQRPVILTKYGLTEEEIEKEHLMTKWWGDSLLLSDPRAKIAPAIKKKGTTIITKRTYDSFQKTPLQKILRKGGIKQLVITGVHAHLCCESTARTAFNKGYLVWLPVDCLATYNEELHLGTLKAAAHGFGIPTTSEKLLKKINKI
ncbi:MAG: isochorismatase family protein [Candidatus Heimdallarchaeota archaeon]|nr:isochorismatase family protein [Candidatus Heimdallarchaeota archaeon]